MQGYIQKYAPENIILYIPHVHSEEFFLNVKQPFEVITANIIFGNENARTEEQQATFCRKQY